MSQLIARPIYSKLLNLLNIGNFSANKEIQNSSQPTQIIKLRKSALTLVIKLLTKASDSGGDLTITWLIMTSLKRVMITSRLYFYSSI